MQGCDGGCDGEVTGGGFHQNWGVSAVVVAKCSGVFLTNRGERLLSGDVLLSWRRALWVVPTDVCAVRATWRQLPGHHHGSMCAHMCMCARVPVQVCGHTYACVYIHVCLYV